MKIRPVILCGGAGTRLWPSLKKHQAKQFIDFFAFHFSSSIMQTLRNFFMKFLVKRKRFISSYLGTVYKN